jgi:hypothetical protein
VKAYGRMPLYATNGGLIGAFFLEEPARLRETFGFREREIEVFVFWFPACFIEDVFVETLDFDTVPLDFETAFFFFAAVGFTAAGFVEPFAADVFFVEVEVFFFIGGFVDFRLPVVFFRAAEAVFFFDAAVFFLPPDAVFFVAAVFFLSLGEPFGFLFEEDAFFADAFDAVLGFDAALFFFAPVTVDETFVVETSVGVSDDCNLEEEAFATELLAAFFFFVGVLGLFRNLNILKTLL